MLNTFTLKFNIVHDSFYKHTARQVYVVIHIWKDGQSDKQKITEEV